MAEGVTRHDIDALWKEIRKNKEELLATQSDIDKAAILVKGYHKEKNNCLELCKEHGDSIMANRLWISAHEETYKNMVKSVDSLVNKTEKMPYQITKWTSLIFTIISAILIIASRFVSF